MSHELQDCRRRSGRFEVMYNKWVSYGLMQMQMRELSQVWLFAG